MEFIVGVPMTSRGHDSIWVVVDPLTKMAGFIPINTNVKTPILARLFVEHLYRLYGLSANIVIVIATLSLIAIFGEQYSIGWILSST